MSFNDTNFIKEVDPIVRKAGSILRTYFGKTLKRLDKANGSFATEADIASEEYLLQELAKVVPEATFLAEESGEQGGEDVGLRWVIDPLDGTTNFAHGFPYFSISVALTLNGRPIFGVVYNPMLDELFHAQDGKGSYCNNEEIHVADRTKLSELVISVGISAKCRLKDEGAFWDQFENVACSIRTFRKLGSAALDMAHVATGRLDAAFFGDLSWWDIAAGTILVEEAGGITLDIDRKKVAPGFESCVASNRNICEDLIDLLQEKSSKS